MATDSTLLAFAHQLADAAGAAIRPYFGAHGVVEAKGDNSPVTEADKAAEAAIRALIEQHYPTHSIYGEEFGQRVVSHQSPVTSNSQLETRDWRLETPFTWVIDPIDGTRAFIAGGTQWGTLIALCEDGVPVLGILDQPITGERWVGVRGQATRYIVASSAARVTSPSGEVENPLGFSGESCRTRPCASLAEAEFSTTSANYFTPVQAKQIVALAQACRHTVKDGDCYAYGLLARGERDIVVDAGLKPYDILALVPIIAGAGGKITCWDGADVTLTNYANVVAVGDVTLYSSTLIMLRFVAK